MVKVLGSNLGHGNFFQSDFSQSREFHMQNIKNANYKLQKSLEEKCNMHITKIPRRKKCNSYLTKIPRRNMKEREREREKEGKGRYWKLEKNDLQRISANEWRKISNPASSSQMRLITSQYSFWVIQFKFFYFTIS